VEPQKRAKYSKPLEPDEVQEVMMDAESDEELEETDEMMEPRVQSSSSQKVKIILRKPKLPLGLEELVVHQMSLILLDLQMASTDQLPPI
jgi:hypothetical protein